MKLITLDEMVQYTTTLFDQYVEPVAYSFMSGEMPALTFMVFRSGTREGDWLSHIRFKNTLTISVFRCEVYLDDVMTLCRKCKMYLITKEVFRVAVVYSMLHPLYQTQYMNFTTNVNTDYESMMEGAGQATYKFMKKHFKFESPIERAILENLRHSVRTFVDDDSMTPTRDVDMDLLIDARDRYDYYMTKYHPLAYRSAKRNKAQTNLIDEDGFILLEKKTKGGTKYIGKDNQEISDTTQ